MSTNSGSADEMRNAVREGYSKVARQGSLNPAPSEGGCCTGYSCCGTPADEADKLAQSIGYNAEELQQLPDGSNMGLSCGNPTAIASLKSGEVVLDLGSGGGFDCFLAGPRVGAEGAVIGVDMTPDMLSKARKNTALYNQRSGLDNVEFRLGEIEHLPIADNSVDVVISNCVINLSPDKPQVWREITRVLKPGGRVAVSDLALLHPLPDQLKQDIQALIGCIAGAVLVQDTERHAREAGLEDIQLEQKMDYIESMISFGDPLYEKIITQLPKGTGPADFVTSLNITAHKPG